MGLLSKAWRGIKKTVKKVARGAKKLAKKTAYAIPGGKKLWDESGRIGKKIMGGIGKVVNAIGPVGMMALSIIAPYAAPLWSAFGAAASAASAAGSIWGTIGTALYNGANWVGATMSSMTSGISKGIGELAKGSFQGAADAASKGFVDAFTGKAGQAGVEAGIKAAGESAIKQAAGDSIFKQTVDKISGDVGLGGDPQLEAPKAPVPQAGPGPVGISEGTQTGIDTTGGVGVAPKATESTLSDKALKLGKQMLKGSLAQEEQTVDYQPIAPGLLSHGEMLRGNTSSRGGVGSGGGQFLSQQMLAAMQASQAKMTRGYGQ